MMAKLVRYIPYKSIIYIHFKFIYYIYIVYSNLDEQTLGDKKRGHPLNAGQKLIDTGLT